MSVDETELEMVERHVEEGAWHIARQRKLIARLKARGLPTEKAEALLKTFEGIQQQHEDHLTHVLGKHG